MAEGEFTCHKIEFPHPAKALIIERADFFTIVFKALAPQAKVVKAFSIYGFENFENSAYPGYNVKPAMLFCGNDAAAKGIVSQLIGELGWEPVDVGGIEQALHLEHMTLLWVRYVRAGKQSPHLVWAALRR